jgi:hypothetical protein
MKGIAAMTFTQQIRNRDQTDFKNQGNTPWRQGGKKSYR